MPRKSVRVEEVDQYIDADLLTDLPQIPSQIERWFTSNIIQRAIAYLAGLTNENVAKMVRISEDGALLVKQAGGTILQKRWFYCNSMSIVEALFPYHYKRFEIVEIEKEGLPLYNNMNLKVAKLSVAPNETLEIPLERFNTYMPAYIMITLLLKGTVEVNSTSWVGSTVYARTKDSWISIAFRNSWLNEHLVINGGSDGGAVYILGFQFFDVNNDLEYNFYMSCPEDEIVNSSTTYYIVGKAPQGANQLAVVVTVQGDGDNPVNITIQAYTPRGLKTIATASVTSSSVVAKTFYIPIIHTNYGSTAHEFFRINIVIDTTGTAIVKKITGQIQAVYEPKQYFGPEYNEYSASNTSTTLTKYTLVDYVKAYKLQNITVDVDIATNGGRAIIYINGKKVLDVTASGTYNIPDIEPVFDVEAELAGDGTNPTSVTFKCYESEGYYMVRRG